VKTDERYKDTAPQLSVVIPTLGRASLVRTLQSLKSANGFEWLEVLVAGHLSEAAVRDQVIRMAAQCSNVRHLDIVFASGDSSKKKNAGWQQARAPLVAFIDDDVVITPDWPLRIVEPFEHPEVGLVSGPGLAPEDVPLMARLAGSALASKAAGYVAHRYQAGAARPHTVKWSSLIGCNMAFRRTVLAEIGGFDPKFWPGEEMLAAFRATRRGHKLIFHSGAALYHYPRQTLAGFGRQMFGYGATRIRLIRAGVDFEPTTLVPALLVLSLPVLALGACFSQWVGLLLTLEILLYLGVCLVCAVLKMLETRRWKDGLILIVIPLMHVSYGFAEWIEWFRPNKDLSGPQ